MIELLLACRRGLLQAVYGLRLPGLLLLEFVSGAELCHRFR